MSKCDLCGEELVQNKGPGRKKRFCNVKCANDYTWGCKKQGKSSTKKEVKFKVKTDMDYIEYFENETDNTVKSFNEVYRYSKIERDLSLLVSIGDIQPGGFRMLTLSNGECITNPMIRLSDLTDASVDRDHKYHYKCSDGLVFDTFREAANYYEVSVCLISRICSGIPSKKLPGLEIRRVLNE